MHSIVLEINSVVFCWGSFVFDYWIVIEFDFAVSDVCTEIEKKVLGK